VTIEAEYQIGITMINPCIVSPGPVALKAGQTLRLRDRLVIHDGPAPVESIQTLAVEWRGVEGTFGIATPN
jgi:hypothetical protein